MFISLFRQFLKTQTETVNDCDKSFICLKGTMKQMNFSFCQAEKTAFLGSTSMATNDGKMCYAGDRNKHSAGNKQEIPFRMWSFKCIENTCK